MRVEVSDNREDRRPNAQAATFVRGARLDPGECMALATLCGNFGAYGAQASAPSNVGETTFHLVYRVRALRRILVPGESTDMHAHASRGVGVPVTAGRLEISFPEGASRSVEMKVGAVQRIEPGTTHRLRNVGDAGIEIVDIELD